MTDSREPQPTADPPRPRWWEYLIYWAVTYWWVLPLGAAGGLLGWWWRSRG